MTVSDLTCRTCGRAGAETPPVPQPCTLPDESAPLRRNGNGTYRRPPRPCPAGRECDMGAVLAGRNERRAELRVERRRRAGSYGSA